MCTRPVAGRTHSVLVISRAPTALLSPLLWKPLSFGIEHDRGDPLRAGLTASSLHLDQPWASVLIVSLSFGWNCIEAIGLLGKNRLFNCMETSQ